MSDAKKNKTTIPTEARRKQGGLIDKTAQQTDSAGRHRGDVDAGAEGPSNTKRSGDLPEDRPEKRPETKGHQKKVREAGPEAMENPPEEWRQEDEESDESFPASDPPANY